jgi:hypothetical protein
MVEHRGLECTPILVLFIAWIAWFVCASSVAHAQSFRSSVEGWGQSYRPAGLLNVEARSYLYPWFRAETQVWTGQAPQVVDPTGDVVVLSAHIRDPEGRFGLRGGRFVLATGAVRPVHIDGAHVQTRSSLGTQVEAFAGSPVVPRFGDRAFDWLAGGRLSQRLGSVGVLGASYVMQRDHGRAINEELGVDVVMYLMRKLSLNGRSAYDLAQRGLAEATLTSSYGSVERRLEVFGSLRNASLILPSTSLFSVLSNTPSVQTGMSGRIRVAPRLRLTGLVAYRSAAEEYGVRAKVGGTLWLSDEGESSIEGEVTRDGVGDGQWTGFRVLVVRQVLEGFRLLGEVELVVPDHPAGKGTLWPWGRLSAQYALFERWQLSAGAEGSSSPHFARLFQALVRVAYHFEVGAP